MSGPRGGRREEEGAPPTLRGLVSRVLRAGVIIAALFFMSGLAVLGVSGNLDYAHVHAAPVPKVLLSTDVGVGDLLLGVGVLVLVFTPVVRIAISVALFAAVGDRPFVAITLFVALLFVLTVVVGSYLA